MEKASGRFVIRVSPELHRRLREEAVRAHLSLNQLCVRKLHAHADAPGIMGGFEEPRGIIGGALVKSIVRSWGAELFGLILFGSAARGDATEESDIDLLIVLAPDAAVTRARYREWDEFCRERLEVRNLEVVSAHFARLPETVLDAGGLWYEASLDGLVLWERERRVTRFLGSVREAMGQGKIRRRMLHGSPYWIKYTEEQNA